MVDVKPRNSQGTFQGSAGMSSCEECSEGKYTDTEGATECSACKAGYVAPERGMSKCQACQPVRKVSEICLP